MADINEVKAKFDAWWSPLGLVKKRWIVFVAGVGVGLLIGAIL